jgi:hypothetical protein
MARSDFCSRKLGSLPGLWSIMSSHGATLVHCGLIPVDMFGRPRTLQFASAYSQRKAIMDTLRFGRGSTLWTVKLAELTNVEALQFATQEVEGLVTSELRYDKSECKVNTPSNDSPSQE